MISIPSGVTIAPMRTLLATLLLLAAAAGPAASAAADPEVIELEVGEIRPLPGFRPLCDDPAVVSLAGGTLAGLRAGETTCSVSSGSPLGPRRIFRVVVRAPAGKGGDGGEGRGRSEG